MKRINILEEYNLQNGFRTISKLTDHITTSSKVSIRNVRTGSELFKGLVLNIPEVLKSKEVINFYSGYYEIVINIGG